MGGRHRGVTAVMEGASETLEQLRAPNGPLATVLPPHGIKDVRLVKVDVEGAELGVLQTNLLPLLRRRRIHHLIVEANPTMWARAHGARHTRAHAPANETQRAINKGAALFAQIASFGYTVRTSALGAESLRGASNISEYFARRGRVQEDFHFALQTELQSADGRGWKHGTAMPVRWTFCCSQGQRACTCSMKQQVASCS